MTLSGGKTRYGAFQLLCVGFVACLISQPAVAIKKVIINNDGGADDASAIIQVLEQPNVLILAVMCSFGNVELEQACDNTRRTLQLMGRADEIPVYAGCDEPLLGEAEFDGYLGDDGFGNNGVEFPLPNATVRPLQAAIALVAYANEFPGEISLLSLGPLTNLAVAYQLDPTLPSKLKEVVIMGGSSHALGNIQPVAEFNICVDSVAASTVIARFNCSMSILTYELCSTFAPSWSWYYEWVSVNTSIAFFIEQTFEVAVYNMQQSNQTYINCDLMTTTVFLYPEIVTEMTRNYAQVETCGQITQGEFVIDYRPGVAKSSLNVDIYTSLDFEQMLEIWQELVSYDKLYKSRGLKSLESSPEILDYGAIQATG